jgi:xanthine/CO dehydrogenase XdhC/CoxF family maturation factor
MDRRETEQLLDAIRQVRASGERAAIATVVRVAGSAYRREGTRMFIRESGAYECALSGGCLEPAVADAAARVIATGDAVVVSYDLADDSLWGLGIGCSGAVDIRIERLEDDAITREWLRVLEQGEAAALVTPLSGASGQLLVRDIGEGAGHLTDSTIEQQAIAQARARLGTADPESGLARIADAEIFFQINTPSPPLVIFGAGHDAVPVAGLAWTLGFTVTIVDVREAFLRKDRLPHATLVHAHYSQFADKVELRDGAFVLVMNHHVERDQESLRFAAESGAAYIGILGPRSRYEKLLAGLAARGWEPPASSLSRVRSPVGLSLGAETPQEIAVSILAELLAIRRGFGGGFLSGSVGSLHRPERRAYEEPTLNVELAEHAEKS